MSLKLEVGGEECEDMEEFEEKAREGLEAIGPIQNVEKGLGHEDILNEEDVVGEW